ncbi:MFS transporter [Frondihabitans cladoniiphilus]|uniref:MFS transporter n=1 Tax=Frondihabitans cladoniiphilus TaxID=715785 RepID=A0ABP8WBF0_9MICO
MSTTEAPEISLATDTPSINRWWIVVAGFISLIVGVNTVSVLWNVLTPSFKTAFGWSNLEISNGLSIFIVFDGISIFTMGFLVDKFGVRRVAPPLAAVFGLGIAALSIVPDNLAVFYVICIIIGCGCGPATQAAYSIVIRAWFGRRRGLALGILNVGLGLCTTIMPLIAGALLTAVGWRGTVGIVGLISAVVLVTGYLLVARMPKQYEVERLRAAKEGRTPGIPFRTIVKTSPRAFWIVCISVFLLSAGTAGVLGQIVPIATGQGATLKTGLALLSVSGLSSIASRFVVGYFLDRVFAPVVAAIVFVLCGVGLALMITTHATPILFLGAILIGLGPGSESDVIAYIISRYVPEHSYGRIYGFAMFLYAQGTALGIFMLGYSITKTGSALTAAWAIVAMAIVSAIVILFQGPYKYKVDGTANPVGQRQKIWAPTN